MMECMMDDTTLDEYSEVFAHEKGSRQVALLMRQPVVAARLIVGSSFGWPKPRTWPISCATTDSKSRQDGDILSEILCAHDPVCT